MDPEQVKQTAFMLTAGAGALAVITSLPALIGARKRHPSAMGSAVLALGGALVLDAVAGFVATRLPTGAGLRGCALMAGLGALLAPLATLLGALCSDESDADDVPPPAAWSLIPGLLLSGLALVELGWMTKQYGVNARVQAEYWTLGLSLGLTWSVLVLRANRGWPGAEALCGNLSGAALISLAIGWTLQLASHHFPAPSTAPWFVIFCGVGLLAGWALSLAVTAIFSAGQGGRGTTLASSVMMALAVFCVAGSAQLHLVREAPLLAGVATGFLGALLLSGLAIGGDDQKPDGLAAQATVLMLAALAWVGFKLMMGLGVAVCAVGFLAAWPCAIAMGVAAPSRFGMPTPQRFAALGGATLALLAAFRVYQEAADLGLSGIDVSDGNVLMALVAGLGLPVLFESVFGRQSATAGEPASSAARAGFEAVLRFLGVSLVTGLAVVCIGLFAGTAGVGCLILGLALWGVTASAAMAATGSESGLPTWRSLPAGLLTAATALIALPWYGVLADVTREQKLQVVMVVAAAALLGLIVGALSRRKPQPQGQATPATGPSQIAH